MNKLRPFSFDMKKDRRFFSEISTAARSLGKAHYVYKEFISVAIFKTISRNKILLAKYLPKQFFEMYGPNTSKVIEDFRIRVNKLSTGSKILFFEWTLEIWYIFR